MARPIVKAGQSLPLRDAAVGIGIAAAIFTLSYANGGFAPITRSYAGIAAWWALGVGAAVGLASARSGVDRFAIFAIGLFSAFAVWILISIQWAADTERCFAQFNQVSLYVAVFTIAILVARLVPASNLIGGAALALSAVATVALVSRCFPSTFGAQPGSTILSALRNRLSYPLGYWNGLGIEVALAYPLLLSIMTSRRSRAASALAALPLPILAAVMYLTSSRGAFVAAAVAVVAFVLLTPRRWPALAAVLVAGASGAAAVSVLVHKTALVDGDVDTPLGAHQGHHAFVWIAIVCAVTALAWAALAELGTRLPSPPRVAGQATAVAIVLLAIVAILLAHPIAKFHDFRSNPVISGSGTETTNHLLSSSGSGRWQFWGASLDEFEAHPLNGGGAGSWQSWWLQHDPIPVFSEFAHSLYLEALGELGIVGFLLIVGAVVLAVVGAIRSALSLASGEIAAAAACGTAFFVAAAYDWVWQLAGIAIVGVGMLGFALGAMSSTREIGWARFGALRPATAVVAVAAIVPQFVVLAAGIHLRNSHAAYNAGDGARARSQALAAKALEPWAASPYLQLGIISASEGNYDEAAHWLDKAISRARNDWTLWATAAIFETKRGAIARARRDLHEAQRLNPRSSLFHNRS